MVVVGDSIAAGQHCDVAWPDLIRGCHVVNRGVSSDTTRTMLERFPRDVQQSGADVCVIQAGHNDANRWVSDRGIPRVTVGAYRENLTEMFLRCRAFEITPVVCSITPVKRDVGYETEVSLYDSELRVVAARLGVPVIDVRGRFLREPHWRRRLLLADGLHLSGEGHRVYADEATGVLAAIAEQAAA